MLYRLVNNLFSLLYWLIIIRVLISWIRPGIRDPRYYKAVRLLYDLTEPILSPIRRFLPISTGLDLSPLIALLLLNMIRGIVLRILI